MAQFTRLLRDVVRERHGIGLDRYPIFDEKYREGLNDKIVSHYYMREIGFEDDDYFIFALRRKMNEIMPYYNQIYKSTLIEFDPMVTVDISQLSDHTGDRATDSASTGDTTTKSENVSRGVNSTTPQTLLSDDGQYASAIADSHSTSNGDEDSKSSSTTNEHNDQTNKSRQFGRSMSAPQIIAELRASFINTDMLVIGELSELFMTIWGSDDNMSSRHGGSLYMGPYSGFPFLRM